MITRQQAWAGGAFRRVREQAQTPSEKKYATLCMKLPSLLKQGGLVQTLAFLNSRDDLGRVLCDHIAEIYGIQREGKDAAGTVLQTRAHQAPLAAYLAMTREVIALSLWFRRFAQSELKAEDQEVVDESA